MADLRLDFDGFWLREGPPSGRRVMRSQLETWLSLYPNDDLRLLQTGPREEAAPARSEAALAVQRRKLRIPQHGLSALLEMGLSSAPDATYTQNFVPVVARSIRTRPVRSVFFHDAIFLSHPEWFTRAERLYFGTAVRSLRNADVVFTSSQAERDRLVRTMPSAGSRVHAVGLGLPNDFVHAPIEVPALDLQPGEFWLAVGRLNARKNLVGLYRALERSGMLSRASPLVIVGTRDGRADGSEAAMTADPRVVLAGAVSDSNLKWLYQNARVFVFPSLDEGFGLPILEAESVGARVALSDIPAFREVAGGGRFFNPLDEDDMARGIAEAAEGGRPAPVAHDGLWARSVSQMHQRLEELVQAKGAS